MKDVVFKGTNSAKSSGMAEVIAASCPRWKDARRDEDNLSDDDRLSRFGRKPVG